MKHYLSLVAGIAIGCLLMLVLKLPWLTPFEQNTASVVAALCSTVLAVIGAFGLWMWQVHTKRQSLDKVLLPVFDPLYAALCQVRDLAKRDTAVELFSAIRLARGDEILAPEVTVIVNFQNEAFPRAVESAMAEARTVLAHWDNVQDIVLAASPKSLIDLLALHRIAGGALAQLPNILRDSPPKFMEQMGPQMSDVDWELLDWAAGRVANVLNRLDDGKRDETGYRKIEGPRRAIIEKWGASAY
jgi:hypothetical protein